MISEIRKIFKLEFFLALNPIFLLIIVHFVFDFNGLYGQDGHEYYRYSRALQSFLTTGIHPGDFFESLYYPLSGAVLGFIFNILFSLQLISFLSLSGSLYFLYRTLQKIYKTEKNIFLYLTIVFLFSPYVFRNSTVVMSDMLTVFFITAAFYFFVSYLESDSIRSIILFSFLSAASVMTRYAAVAVIAVPAFILLFNLLKNKKWVQIFIMTAVLAVVLIPHFIIRPFNITGFLTHPYLQDWSAFNYFKKDFIATDGIQNFSVQNIFYVFSNLIHPRFLAFGIFFIFFLQPKIFLRKNNFPGSQYLLVAIFTVVVYALFLVGIPHQNNRFLLLSYPFVVIIFFNGYTRLLTYLSKIKFLVYIVIIIMLAVQIFLSIYTFIPIYQRNILEKEITSFVINNEYENVYTFDIDISFMSYKVDKNIINMWNERINNVDSSSVVIFNEDKFRVQWADMNPMINWTKLKSDYNLYELKDFGDGWKAYEIRIK